MRKTSFAKKSATSRSSKARTSSRSSATKKKRSSSLRAKKFNINFNYLAGVFLSAAVLVAVFLGIQFGPKDDLGQVAGVTNSKGSVFMVMPKQVKVGDTIKAVVWADSDYKYNAAQANFTYTNNLEFVKVDDSNSAFDVDPPVTTDGNNVNFPKGTLTPLSDSQQLGTVEFTAVAEGKAVVALTDKTMLLTSEGNNNLVGQAATYTINVVK